ncbi:MAG: VPLPA-CTERM sorting domain-containing protein, partial [Pseudomonadota bacterium]
LLSASSLFFSVQALADLTNGPDPYAAGFGFDTPTEAGWGWDRGDAGTIYAEWEHWAGASNPTAPDVGVSGTPSATFGWNPGTFPASSGNLYSFSGTEIFDIDIDGSNGPSSGPVLVTLQTETWGNDIGYDNVGNPIPGSILLNGAGPTSTTVTYLDPAYSSSFGPVALTQTLFTWALGSSASNYDFDLAGGPHMSFAQVAVDVGAVPIPAAALLFISGVLGLFGVSRRRQAV